MRCGSRRTSTADNGLASTAVEPARRVVLLENMRIPLTGGGTSGAGPVAPWWWGVREGWKGSSVDASVPGRFRPGDPPAPAAVRRRARQGPPSVPGSSPRGFEQSRSARRHRGVTRCSASSTCGLIDGDRRSADAQDQPARSRWAAGGARHGTVRWKTPPHRSRGAFSETRRPRWAPAGRERAPAQIQPVGTEGEHRHLGTRLRRWPKVPLWQAGFQGRMLPGAPSGRVATGRMCSRSNRTTRQPPTCDHRRTRCCKPWAWT